MYPVQWIDEVLELALENPVAQISIKKPA
ncbi:MAG: hypothetical protein L7U57_00715 [Glaciecola sp.]|nr:hypothetical protein [Glaciecola sp.]